LIFPYDVFKESEKVIRENLIDQYVKIFLIEEMEI